jgi:hypothetical protein
MDSLHRTGVHSDDEKALEELVKLLGERVGLKPKAARIIRPKVSFR